VADAWRVPTELTRRTEADAMKSQAPAAELVTCETEQVAEWIGLNDHTLLGSQPIELPTETVEKPE
jgi:hypothetical protein